tara:strand:- start:176 stop:517 length:342 start_codon:yes stop_codon:yes gene_type:complete
MKIKQITHEEGMYPRVDITMQDSTETTAYEIAKGVQTTLGNHFTDLIVDESIPSAVFTVRGKRDGITRAMISAGNDKVGIEFRLAGTELQGTTFPQDYMTTLAEQTNPRGVIY